METENKETHLNYLMLIGILLIFFAGIVVAIYQFNYKKNECIANPLVYGAKQLTEQTGSEFIGSGFFLAPINIQSPVISFNSTNLWVVD